MAAAVNKQSERLARIETSVDCDESAIADVALSTAARSEDQRRQSLQRLFVRRAIDFEHIFFVQHEFLCNFKFVKRRASWQKICNFRLIKTTFLVVTFAYSTRFEHFDDADRTTARQNQRAKREVRKLPVDTEGVRALQWRRRRQRRKSAPIVALVYSTRGDTRVIR